MAKYLQGIIGAFSGKIGPVIGSSRNGVPYMKGRGTPRSGPVGEKEAENRNKFAIGHAWLKPLLEVLRVGFAGYSRTTYGYNAAKSYNFKHAMENGQVIPAMVKISSGNLPLPEQLTATLEDNFTFRFNWSSAYTELADRKDQLMVLVYHPESRTAIYEIHGAFRESGTQLFDVSSEIKGKAVHVYAAFIAADRSRQSDSVYLGEFMG
ncbi:MAG: hypothetical protein JWQ28_3307 [Pedobacter sp.]|jgi:hypothetical protein|nr:hypothetical protein [Pedobacter sp.]